MPRSRSFRRSYSRPGGRRQQTRWVDTAVGVTIATGAQTLVGLMGDLEVNESVGFRLLRTLVKLYLRPATPGAVNGSQLFTCGMGVASGDEFAAAAVPDPTVMADFPPRGWVVRDQDVVFDSTSSTDQNPTVMAHDLKAQRNVNNGELYLVFENDPSTGSTFSLAVSGIVRCLFAMP